MNRSGDQEIPLLVCGYSLHLLHASRSSSESVIPPEARNAKNFCLFFSLKASARVARNTLTPPPPPEGGRRMAGLFCIAVAAPLGVPIP